MLGDPLRVLPDLVMLSRATVAIIRQNILIFAFGLNAVAMGSAVLGILGPVAAAILHQAGSLLVLLNAMRLLAFGDWRHLPRRGLRSLARRSVGWMSGSTPAWPSSGSWRVGGSSRRWHCVSVLALCDLRMDRDRPGRGGPAPAGTAASSARSSRACTCDGRRRSSG